jgi:protoheme IX farnesyltransferase
MKKNKATGIFSTLAGLVKLKLSLAVVLSSVTGYFLFHSITDLSLVFLSTGVLLLASGSAVLNQYTERKSDALMERTKNRPIPAGKVSEKKALLLSAFLMVAGSMLLYVNGVIPLLLGILTVLLYNLFYTKLKKVTMLAIIPGALVGAIPPLIGFTSAGGSFSNPKILAFAGFMFLWQLPHFWLIIIKYRNDYNAAGFATITRYLNDLQIKYLVFAWVLASTVYLIFFFSLTEGLNKNMFILFSFLNFTFIITFYRLLFAGRASRNTKSAFILINSFSLLIMLLLITISIIKGI